MAKSKSKAKTKAKPVEEEDEKPKKKDRDRDQPQGPRARMDVYVMMLFTTLMAIIGGSVLMHLDFEEYGNKAPPKEPALIAPKLGESAKLPEPAGGGPAPKGPDPMPMDPMGGDPKMP